MYIIHHTFCSLIPQYCLNSMLQFCSKESVASCESSDQTPGAGSCSLDILEHRPAFFLCEALALALNLRQCWRMGNPIHSVQERLEQIQHHRVFKTTKAKLSAFRISRIFLRLRRSSAVWVEAKMYQEDGRLRYIEGVDNGDAPAHDGTFEAGHLMNHVSDSVVICDHMGLSENSVP